jgi:hypothetical protein
VHLPLPAARIRLEAGVNPRRFLEAPAPSPAFVPAFGDLTLLLLAFFVLAGSWTSLGGHLHAALPKDMSGG